MRPLFALLAVAALTAPSFAADLRNFDDAALHAVQFVDAHEGWAVGDQGVVLHTIDGGTTWERQPTGVRGSLRSVSFVTPYYGWTVGREELPNGGGSTGVLLATQDGGLKWKRVVANSLPGLHIVRFFDDKNGIVAGDGSEAFPTGLITTADGGRTWRPLAGPRCPSWLAADFPEAKTGALTGAWSRMATWRDGAFGAADVDSLKGLSIQGLRIQGTQAVAVGQGGLVLLSANSSGRSWGVSDLKLPPAACASLDFQAVQSQGDHIWLAGRPGSLVLHSPDRGQTWQPQWTGQNLPLHGLFFLDARTGWAVGELGTVLATTDGGQSWKVQKSGGERAAVLFVNAKADGVPLGTVARLGGADGYLTAALRVTSADSASAKMTQCSDPQRLEATLRRAGGAAAESLWQFPVPEHLERVDAKELLRSWDRLNDGQAAKTLLRQMVLAIRMWQPDVIVTDQGETVGKTNPNGPAEELVAVAVREAFEKAADPRAFPEQLDPLGLKAWKVSKLYARSSTSGAGGVQEDWTEVCPRLRATLHDFAAEAAVLLPGPPATLPNSADYRLLAAHMEGAASHRDFLQGIDLAPGGTARRELEADPAPESDRDISRAIQTRRTLEALTEGPINNLAAPEQMLAQIGPALDALPPDQGAPAAFAVASRFARIGQWELAREAFLLLVDRYPTHPLAADGYRWLIRYGSSSEARRRHEMGQFVRATESTLQQADKTNKGTIHGGPEEVATQRLALLGSLTEVRKWYEGPLQVAPRLAALGPVYERDPATQFCLQAANRTLGKFDEARAWYTRFLADHPDGPWHDAAAAEMWLTHRNTTPPKLIAACPQTSRKPLLDGQLDDACWKDRPGLRLVNAVGDTAKESPTEAWLAYDDDYLYLAVRCKHPAEHYVEPSTNRRRDADLSGYDHVSLLLDLDRDYNTYFRLEVDQRGCVCEDCWGDKSWDPRWFVSVKSEPTGWQMEAAIPLSELTGDPVNGDHVWACNVVRTLPGRGVQAWSLPADVEPRPEGLGLLMFVKEMTPAATAVTPLPRKTVAE